MGIETTLADRKVTELPKVTNSNSKTRKNRRRQKKMSPVQRLFETCREVFSAGVSGVVPPLEDIQRLRSVLGMFFGYSISNYCVFGIASLVTSSKWNLFHWLIWFHNHFITILLLLYVPNCWNSWNSSWFSLMSSISIPFGFICYRKEGSLNLISIDFHESRFCFKSLGLQFLIDHIFGPFCIIFNVYMHFRLVGFVPTSCMRLS